jgi:hypothetical protein
MRPSARRDPITFEGKPGHWSYSIQGMREPKRDEYYLSGAIVQAWRAPNDLTTKYLVVVPLRQFVMRSEWQLANRQRRPYLNERRYESEVSTKEIE